MAPRSPYTTPVRVCFLSRTRIDLRDNHPLLLGRLHNGLYRISFPPNGPHAALTSTTNSSIPWHSRLGHPGQETLSVLARQFSDLITVKQSIPCDSCNKAKSHKIVFNKNTTVTSKPFDLIHTDVWGPASLTSSDGFRYYIIFIDDHTRFSWIYFLHTKQEALANFKNLCTMVRTQYKTTPKILRSDGGGEYTSHAFKSFLQDNGILQQLSCPHTPEQNGLSERKHRHLLDITRALLIESGLPHKFWAEATSTANLLINLLPSKAISNKIPAQCLHGIPPTYSHLRTFGCLCYPWLRPYTTDKFSPRSQACVFIGYSPLHKGYKCYNPSTGKTHVSRHVVFYEHQFPYKHFDNPGIFQALSPSAHIPPSLLIPTSTLANIPPPIPSPIIRQIHAPSIPPSSNQDITQPDMNQDPHPSLLPQASVNNNPPTHHMQTRSKSGIHKPKQFLNLLTHTNSISTPTTYNQAAKSAHWQQAMLTEFNALQQQATWTLVQPPLNKPVLGCKWIYKTKMLPNGQVDRYKARLVALGYNQKFGINYTETFSPVAKMPTIRLLLTLALNRKWPMHQLDIFNAFLHGDLPDDIYMRQPPGFIDQHHPNAVCKLQKSLYGLKQAPRQWFQKLTSFLQSKGFTISRADPSLLILDTNSTQLFILIYVDDFLVTGNDPVAIQNLLQQLQSQFALKQLGNISLFLGIQVLQSTSGYFLSQKHYASKLIIDAGFENCKPAPTPIAPESQKTGKISPPFHDPTLYRRLAGSLQYLSITRPDIAFATNRVCQHMQQPTDQDFKALKRLLRYIKGTLSYGLPISVGSLELHSYSDADWASDSSDRKSISGFCTFLGPNLISWTVKKQTTVAKSSTEAEYRSLSAATSEVIWLRRLAAELHLPQPYPTTIHCDNTSAIAIAKNPVFHARTKHIEIDYHFIRQQISTGEIKLVHISSKDQVADIFTKPFSLTRFIDLRNKLTIRSSNA
ncbi:Retrovirus-related Pol polyprotein from transposon TNT 1-94 [Dendrobium catenatum]|uniref:Retrovirus-related Pol polyprotein from transposon TNT 1-94 n=1 Tax=Dendrobium catenatum TaxID=906689 RepID=A0A2I0VPM4_9ASPA|nr:Retrovirus-related Pol polyprotein from transposon TNT 1-94 [Dendrobium catenatum]